MADCVTKFQSILVNLGSSRRYFPFFYCQLHNLLTVFFPVSRDVQAFSERLVSVYIRRRDFYDLKSGRVENGTVVEKRSLLICGDLLWISISVTSG